MPATAPTRPSFWPPWWATLVTLLVTGLFVAAGLWQLERAAEKRAFVASFDAGEAQVAQAAPGPGEDHAALRHRRITASGRFDPAHQILLDARMHDGYPGYEVLTPLVRDGLAVLVNRGWMLASGDRTRLPDLAVGDAPRTVTGLLDLLPRPALERETPPVDPAAPWPRRMLYPKAAEIGAALGYPVADYQLLLAPEEPDGYVRSWRPVGLTPVQHVGYAAQWFALALAVVVTFIVVNRRRPRS